MTCGCSESVPDPLPREDWDARFTVVPNAAESDNDEIWTVVAATQAEDREYIYPGFDVHNPQAIFFVTTAQRWTAEDKLKTWYWK